MFVNRTFAFFRKNVRFLFVTFLACPLIIEKNILKGAFFLETEEFNSQVEKYKAELTQLAARSTQAENRVGTPITLPEDNDAVINFPEISAERDPLQTFDSVPDTFDSFRQRNTSAGWLRVQAFAGPQTYPVPNADVLVTRDFVDGVRRFASGKTDRSGILDGITLPAPDNTLAQDPGTIQPYALYDIRVSHPDYRTEIYKQVPIFPGIKSIQPVQFQSSQTGI